MNNGIGPNRRAVLAASAALGALGPFARVGAQETTPVIKHGRLKQSLCRWCFTEAWPTLPEMIQVAKRLGCSSIELLGVNDLATVKDAGLECAITSIDMGDVPPFVRGWNNPRYREQVTKATKQAIEATAAHGFPNVIAFTGMREDIPDDVGARHCVEGLKSVAGFAERNKVTLCLEMLNSRVGDHPMKGHPGYQGDHTDYCVEILKRVGSPNVKLLFDVYHVQIMDGDLIRRIREHKEWIAHVHTAGNPGRGELDAAQEIHYPAVMRALVEIGYQGHVGQEFIPTRDAWAGLSQAVAACDVA